MNATIGVLALQGAFTAHRECLARAGADSVEVRTPSDLDSVRALIIPGGESSTMSQLLESSGLLPEVSDRIAEGMPVMGTCAGLILLASEVSDGRDDQHRLRAIDVAVRRNAYGRQRDSFETDLDTPWGTVRGVFIRAPRIERTGPGVEVLASHAGEPVLVRENRVLGATFHPEISGSAAVHEYFVSMSNDGKA